MAVWAAAHGEAWAAGKIGFEEASGYKEGVFAPEAGWQVLPGTKAEIDGQEKAAGVQSLKIEATGTEAGVTYVDAGLLNKGVRFVDLQIKPVALEEGAAQTGLGAWGSTVGFVKAADGTMSVAVMSGEETQIVATGIEASESHWVRLTMRQDLTTKKWDLYVDGRLVAIDRNLDTEGLGELAIFGNEEGPTWVDEISTGKENPLFADSDQDGMPDAEEVARGLNPYLDDRLGDLNGDGVSNILEMLRGAAGRAPGTGLGSAIIYVDNLSGSDANNGKRSYAVGGDGPKASIKAATAAARDGDMVVIMPGRGTYAEGSLGERDKSLTIKILDNTSVQ